MDLTCKPSLPNARRIKRLTLEANTFEEERILQALFDLIDFGGKMDIDINKSGAFPARGVECEFTGERDVRD